MRRSSQYRKTGLLSLLIGWLAAGCSQTAPSALDPRGPAAQRITDLTWLLFIMGGVIYLIVMAYLVYALFRRRRTEEPLDPRRDRGIILGGGVGLTFLVLLVVYVATMDVLGQVGALQQPSGLTVRVTGEQWWWRVEYPEQGFETANEIHIPVGEPVLLELRSNDVIHSFWVPQLHGKKDLIPGRVNTFWIEAAEAGVYWGECAEYCGTQHAKMQFVVVAEPRESYDAWVASQQQEVGDLSNPYYEQGLSSFMLYGCGGCHTIAGTPANGAFGPDLTHLASRLTIAAGALPNSPGSLAGWVANPQGVKPGNKMPAIEIEAEDLTAIVNFLQILE